METDNLTCGDFKFSADTQHCTLENNILEKLSSNIIEIMHKFDIEDNQCMLQDIKKALIIKADIIKDFKEKFNYSKGKIARNFYSALIEIERDFKDMHANFDDKLLIFIVGNGNVGKSTLINALTGYEVAATNFLPTTWKIDVYSSEIENALIKFKNGSSKYCETEIAKKIIEAEENKTKEAKKIYNKIKNERLQNVVNEEERKEIIKSLEEKYLYCSDIVEVRWPIKGNRILDKCLFVDTPGLNQERSDSFTNAGVYDYYHKADGVIWLFDASTISASSGNKEYNSLSMQLNKVGGVRDNIIGVLNRIDNVKKNGGVEAANKVIMDSIKLYKNKFSNLIPISAKQAFEGISKDNQELIKESGIDILKKIISDIFIKKSEEIKNNSKNQNHNKLIIMTEEKIEQFEAEVFKYKKEYEEKNKKIRKLKTEEIKNVKKKINVFLESYLKDVEGRVTSYIYELGKEGDISIVNDKMYEFDKFLERKKNLSDNIKFDIDNSASMWNKIACISEYKYISNEKEISIFSQYADIKNVDVNINNLVTTTPINTGLLGFLEGLFKGIVFEIKKKSIMEEINLSIKKVCEEIKRLLIYNFESIIERKYETAVEILNLTYENLLFDYKNTDNVLNDLKVLKAKVKEKNKKREISEILI